MPHPSCSCARALAPLVCGSGCVPVWRGSNPLPTGGSKCVGVAAVPNDKRICCLCFLPAIIIVCMCTTSGYAAIVASAGAT